MTDIETVRTFWEMFYGIGVAVVTGTALSGILFYIPSLIEKRMALKKVREMAGVLDQDERKHILSLDDLSPDDIIRYGDNKDLKYAVVDWRKCENSEEVLVNNEISDGKHSRSLITTEGLKSGEYYVRRAEELEERLGLRNGIAREIIDIKFSFDYLN